MCVAYICLCSHICVHVWFHVDGFVWMVLCMRCVSLYMCCYGHVCAVCVCMGVSVTVCSFAVAFMFSGG